MSVPDNLHKIALSSLRFGFVPPVGMNVEPAGVFAAFSSFFSPGPGFSFTLVYQWLWPGRARLINASRSFGIFRFASKNQSPVLLLPKIKVIGYGQEILANDVTKSIQWEGNVLTFEVAKKEKSQKL